MLLTLFPLLGYLNDQCSEFLKLWMANHGFGEFPNLIKYYTTIGNGTLLKEEYTTTNNHTLHNDKKIYVPYQTEFLRGHSQPNPTNV